MARHALGGVRLPEHGGTPRAGGDEHPAALPPDLLSPAASTVSSWAKPDSGRFAVAGAGACLVDPYDPDSIHRGLLRIIGEPAYREELLTRARENVARYSLTNVTEEYIALYRRLLRQKASPEK